MINKIQRIHIALAVCYLLNLPCTSIRAETQNSNIDGWAAKIAFSQGKPIKLLCDINAVVNPEFSYEAIYSIRYPSLSKNGQPTETTKLDALTLEVESTIRKQNMGVCVAHETGFGFRKIVCYLANYETAKSVKLAMPAGFKATVKIHKDPTWSTWSKLKSRIDGE